MRRRTFLTGMAAIATLGVPTPVAPPVINAYPLGFQVGDTVTIRYPAALAGILRTTEQTFKVNYIHISQGKD